MTLLQKVRWIASILLVFFVVLATNLIDKQNFNRLRYSVNTIYEDRMVAVDLLFELSTVIQAKEVALISLDSSFLEREHEQTNQKIESLIEQYEQTKLISKEQTVFQEFKEELRLLINLETEYLDSKSIDNRELLKSIKKIDQNLYTLSKIQLEEGRRQMGISNKAVNMLDLFAQAEIFFLVILAILLQAVFLYRPKKKT